MALVNHLFSNCFTGGGPPISKIFEIDTTGGWINDRSYVIYSGDGMCYGYIGTSGGHNPKQTFLVPNGTNSAGACNQNTGCPSVNTNVYYRNLYYTFSACCDGSTFSFRRGDIELSNDYINGTVMYLNYSGSGGMFTGCATVITGYTGSTIYIDTKPIFNYKTTIPYPPYSYFSDCADCVLYYPCVVPPTTQTPTPTKTPTPTPTTTPIICGSGLTTSQNFYYTDCCGNLVTAKGNVGTVIRLNYTQPYNGITKLNVPATTSCSTPTVTQTSTPTPTVTQTPTYTPTNTSTPKVTPSPTPTVSVSKVYSLKNDCDVITLFDMGVQCNIIQNPSNQYSNNGVLSLNVTGGTSPYSYYWAGGQRSKTLVGIPEGSYEVMVVDYYGDYSSTTICNLFAPSQTPTQTITPTPTITPSPVWGDLCFTYVNLSTSYGPIQFTPYGNANGKPTWTGTYQGNLLLIQWSSASGRWAISGLPFTTGIPVSYNQGNIPTGNWSLLGGSGKPIITTVQGVCPPVIPLSISVNKQNSSCPGFKNCDGSISIYAFNGVPPYSYSINNGLTYQSSGIFNGLCANNYTVIVQDSGGNTANGGVVPVGAANAVINYAISTQLLNVVSYSPQNEVASWKVNITPPLPVGATITFQLKVNATQKVNTPGAGTIVNTTTVKKNGVVLSQPTVTTASNTVIRQNCSPNTTTTTSNTQLYSLTMSHGDTITGTSSSVLTITTGAVSPNGCITTLQQDILVSIYGNAGLTGKGSCGEANSNPTAQGIVNHTLASSTSVNPISLRTLTGTTSCNGGQTGVYGTTSLQTIYTNASPGFVDGATVYTNSSLNVSTLVPDNVVFRYPNSTSSNVYVVIGGQMTLVGPYGSTC